MTSHQATVPAAAANYFRLVGVDTYDVHPIIVGEFRPGKGWVSTRGWRKRVSGAWCRKLRRQGVDHVALEAAGHVADFSTRELSR